MPGDGKSGVRSEHGILGLEAKVKCVPSSLLSPALMLFASRRRASQNPITVDKNAQLMTVAVDGVERYQWPVSTGLPSYETPNGSFKTFRMEEDHYSKEFDDAPMPHAIFFTKLGHAIHGTDSVNRLGSPASHGCVRLSRANAATLYALVEKDGVLNATVTLTGSSQVALARNPRPPRQHRGGAPRRRRRSTIPPAIRSCWRRGRACRARSRRWSSRRQAASSGRRRLHLSGRRLLQRGALSGAARPALYGARSIRAEQYYYDRGYAPQYAPQGYYQPRQLLSAARAVHLSGLTRIATRSS